MKSTAKPRVTWSGETLESAQQFLAELLARRDGLDSMIARARDDVQRHLLKAMEISSRRAISKSKIKRSNLN